MRAGLNDRRAWAYGEARFPPNAVEPFVVVLYVFGDALPCSEAAALGRSEFGRYTGHV